MDKSLEIINHYLVDIFNEILNVEEQALQLSQFDDLSIKEMHTIETVGLYGNKTMTQIANDLHITVGTLTVAIKTLVRKGYVERVRSNEDRRVIYIKLTPKGRLLYRMHARFHRKMVKETVAGIQADELKVLTRGLENLHCYLLRLVEEQKKQKEIIKQERKTKKLRD